MIVGPVSERVQAIVTKVLRHRLSMDRVPLELNFHDLCIDPIDRFFICAEVEQEWNIQLSDDEIERWASMQDIAETVKGLAFPVLP